MKRILNTLFEQKTLTRDESKEVLINIAREQYTNAEIAAFITVFLMRPISVDELSGFREALMDLAIKVDLSEFNTIDLCGTGGDGKNTFNISTLTSFIVAGTGNKVAKHGNYGVSSVSGSSNVLEALGYQFTGDVSTLKKQIDQSNICFLHAPLFQPAMKVVAPIRRALGVKTFFNMLGPLVNPSQPQNQFVGVFNLEIARVYHYILQKTKLNYGVVYSLDGYDEISLTSPFKLFTSNGEQYITPRDLGVREIDQKEIYGGKTVKDAAEIFVKIISNQGTEAQTNVVLSNAAKALQILDAAKSFDDAFQEAKASLESGRAKACLASLVG